MSKVKSKIKLIMSLLPKAIIFFNDRFFAESFRKLLEEKNLDVVLCDGLDRLSLIGVEYVFDMVGERGLWRKLEGSEIKLCVVGFETEIELVSLSNLKLDFRQVVGLGVVGAFIRKNKDWLHRALVACVLNKNLEIADKSRLLYLEDFLDAVVRYTIFSGTVGKTYLVCGEEVDGKKLAEALFEEGKMTKKQFKIENLKFKIEDYQKALEDREVIRFKPKTDMAEFLPIVLKPYFEHIDIFLRNPEKAGEVLVASGDEKRNPREEVEVEEKEQDNPSAQSYGATSKSDVISKIETKTEDTKAEVSQPVPQPDEKPDEEITVNRDIDREIKEVIPESKKVEAISKIETKTEWWHNWVLSVIAGILLAIFGMFLWFFAGIKSLEYDIKNFEKRVVDNNWVEIEDRNKANLAFLEQLDGVLNWPGFSWWLGGNREMVRVAQEGVFLQGQLRESMELSKKVAGGVWGEEMVVWREVLPRWRDSLISADTGLARLEARLSGNLSWVPGVMREKVKNYKSEITKWRELVHFGVEGLPVLSELIAADGRRKSFLVLLQNESELRATGGFIGSYGVLTFEDGKFLDFRVRDVYAADGQIKGYVEPPEPIVKILGEASWKMRDANWQPYFVAAARDVRWFYEKATGEKVDGVIGLTLASVEKLLGVTGPIKLSDFGVNINSDNLYEQAQFFAEKNFFPGSTQKQSFLGELSRQLFEELRLLKGREQGELVMALIDSLNKRDTQLAFNDQVAFERANMLGWDGGLYRGECVSANCFADYLMINESNLGVNKANFFVRREVEILPTLDNSGVRRRLRVAWENTANSTNWPAGNYRNYMRVYTPLGTRVETLAVFDPEKPGERLVYNNGQYKQGVYGDKSEVGFLVEIPIGSRRVLELDYFNPVTLDLTQKSSYLLYIQRQSGFGKKTKMGFKMVLPKDTNLIQAYPELAVEREGLAYNGLLESDLQFGIELAP